MTNKYTISIPLSDGNCFSYNVTVEEEKKEFAEKVCEALDETGSVFFTTDDGTMVYLSKNITHIQIDCEELK